MCDCEDGKAVVVVFGVCVGALIGPLFVFQSTRIDVTTDTNIVMDIRTID